MLYSSEKDSRKCGKTSQHSSSSHRLGVRRTAAPTGARSSRRRASTALSRGSRGVGWLPGDGAVARARRVLCHRAVGRGADRLELRALRGDDSGSGGTLDVEGGLEEGADGSDIGGGNTEGLRGEADLGDEVADFVRVKAHVPER